MALLIKSLAEGMSISVWRVSLYIAWWFSIVYGQQIYYCRQGVTQTINGESQGVIKTREDENGFRANNLLCSWVIDAGAAKRVKLTVDVWDLQWSSQYATCSGYDNLEIIEGDSVKGKEITSICGARSPYNVVSKGRYLFLQFSSTHQNFGKHKGVELTFETFENTSCPPGWFQVSSESTDCFMVGSQATAKWAGSQDICTYSQSNLASLTSEMEYQTVLAHGRNQSVMKAWIGLSDLASEGYFIRWIDLLPVDYKRPMSPGAYNKHCVVQDLTGGDWTVENCDNLLNYVCKAKKDGSTILYKAEPSSAPPEEESSGSKAYLIVIIFVVLIVLVLAGVLVYCCIMRKRGKTPCICSDSPSSNAAKDNIPETHLTFPEFDRQTSARPTAPPVEEIVMVHDPQIVAPPTYEESRHHPIAPSNY